MAGRFGEIVEIMDSNLFLNSLKFKVGERYALLLVITSVALLVIQIFHLFKD